MISEAGLSCRAQRGIHTRCNILPERCFDPTTGLAQAANDLASRFLFRAGGTETDPPASGNLQSLRMHFRFLAGQRMQ